MAFTESRLFSDFVAAPDVGGVRQPDFEQLNSEIVASAITISLIAPKSRPISATNVGIEFDSALGGGDTTILDNLIAAHDGTGNVRGVDTHSFSFPGGPLGTDDETVISADGLLARYQLGDFGVDFTVSPARVFVAADLSVGAAKWEEQANLASVTALGIPSLQLTATNDAIAVSTSPGPIAYNSSNLSNIQGFFSYSSPTLTALKPCKILLMPRLDSSVNSGSTRSGIRLDIRVNDVSEQVFDNNSSTSGGSNANDTQNNVSSMFDVAINDTIKVFCNSYITGLSDVWGGPNRLQLLVLEDLT